MVMTTNTSASSKPGRQPASDKVANAGVTARTSDMFTKLLVAQIRNQDPLAPQDPTQFVNQLSQLSQTEALQNLSQTTSANASVLQACRRWRWAPRSARSDGRDRHPAARRRQGQRQHR
jgi:flagellar basal-body rod modification protein FlgD